MNNAQFPDKPRLASGDRPTAVRLFTLSLVLGSARRRRSRRRRSINKNRRKEGTNSQINPG